MLVAGVAAVSSQCRHIAVAAVLRVAAAAPCVVAQARPSAAAAVGGKAALVVGDGVSHGLSIIGCGKDSEKFDCDELKT